MTSEPADIRHFKRPAVRNLSLEREVEGLGIGSFELAVNSPGDSEVVLRIQVGEADGGCVAHTDVDRREGVIVDESGSARMFAAAGALSFNLVDAGRVRDGGAHAEQSRRARSAAVPLCAF